MDDCSHHPENSDSQICEVMTVPVKIFVLFFIDYLNLCVHTFINTWSKIIVVFLNPLGNIKSEDRTRDVFLASTLRVKNILFSAPKESIPGDNLILRRKIKDTVNCYSRDLPGIFTLNLRQISMRDMRDLE